MHFRSTDSRVVSTARYLRSRGVHSLRAQRDSYSDLVHRRLVHAAQRQPQHRRDVRGRRRRSQADEADPRLHASRAVVAGRDRGSCALARGSKRPDHEAVDTSTALPTPTLRSASVDDAVRKYCTTPRFHADRFEIMLARGDNDRAEARLAGRKQSSGAGGQQ